MAIFSRRTLHRLINENASFLSQEQLDNHVKKLNEGDLSFEWEIVLLNVFNKIGKLTHEPDFENCKRKIDILFSSKSEEQINFLADIATISDYFAEKENPIEYLDERLFQIKIKYNLRGGFGFEVEGDTANKVFQKKRQKLYLPLKSDFDREIFNKDFEVFIKEILKDQNYPRVHHIKRDKINLKIKYSPSGIIHSIYPSYKEIISLEDNTVWKTLIRKYKQLKATNYPGNIGIILCDGNCNSLKSYSKSRNGKTSGDVIRHFLSKKNKVSFVLSVWTKKSFDYGAKNTVIAKIYKGKNFDDNLEKFFSSFLKNLDTLFPIPSHDATNAVNMLKANPKNKGDSFCGGVTWSYDEIEISMRTVLDFLAGKISKEQFPESYLNSFEDMLDKGKLITQIEIKKGSNESDDDWLVFKFGEPDPAISLFVVPNKEK